MELLWFGIVWGMLGVYVVLDGFDFGVGIVHRLVARTDEERRVVLAAIAPVWDGNEVWLIAAGGTLFMAFPRTYATAFSGFYLALMIVLWLLILRGVALEFRSHQENALWREFWDAIFSIASVLLALVLGAALGNVVRGAPITEAGLPGMALFTNFRPEKHAGLFDWYTILVGLFAVIALAGHGALFLAWRTTGAVQSQSAWLARRIWGGLIPVWIVTTIATASVQRELFSNIIARPWSLTFVLMAIGGLVAILACLRRHREFGAFLGSCAFLLGLMAATMSGVYPYWLRSTIDPAYSLTAHNTVAASYGLERGLIWWTVGIGLTAGHFFFLYRSLRAKVELDRDPGY